MTRYKLFFFLRNIRHALLIKINECSVNKRSGDFVRATQPHNRRPLKRHEQFLSNKAYLPFQSICTTFILELGIAHETGPSLNV